MYRWMILLSIVLGVLTASYLMHKKSVPGNYILLSVFLNILLVLHGGITATYFLSSGTNKGLNATGGALGILIGSLIFSLITPEYRGEYFRAYTIALPLMYGVAKIGCCYAGCCAGMQYSGPFAITNSYGIKIFPVQIVEVIVFLELFVIALVTDHLGKYDPFTAAIVYSIVKILLDFLRDTHVSRLISPNQYFCFMIILFCIVLKYLMKRHGKA